MLSPTAVLGQVAQDAVQNEAPEDTPDAELDPGPGPGLQAQLEALAAAEDVAVTGMERIGEAAARELKIKGEFRQRLSGLLSGYNYVLLHDSSGRVSEVRILGSAPSEPPGPRRYTVSTTRRGAQHEVMATLVGRGGLWRQIRLIVDTGAATVALPASEIGRLGFRKSDLTEIIAETAGGQVKAQSGRLDSVTVGQAVVRDVVVIFIDDAQIGDTALLGMSFLDRFQFSLDDALGQIVLTAR